MILAQGEPVRRVIISRLRKRHKVRRVDEAEFALRHPNPQPAGDTLKIVDFKDLPAKAAASTGLRFIGRHLLDSWLDGRAGRRRLQKESRELAARVWKITRNERITKSHAVIGIRDQQIPTMDEARKNPTGIEVACNRSCGERDLASRGHGDWLPKFISPEVEEWILR